MRFNFSLLIFLCFCNTLFAQQVVCMHAVNAVSQDSLTESVLKLTGRKKISLNGADIIIASRQANHWGNNIAADYIKNVCTQYGFVSEDLPYSNTGRNIVMYKNGTVNKKTAYILCAHYDCVGSATAPFQGADDNASGVAALLEAARVLQNDSFPHTLVLAFWDEEEIGLIGSKAFAPDGPLGFWDVKGVINLDMIGYDGNNDSLGLVHVKPVGNSILLGDKLISLNQKLKIGLQTRVKNPGETATDQQSFWLKGATAIGFTEDYDQDFSPHWHKPSDSIENMHLGYFTKMTKLAIASICEISFSPNLVSVSEVKGNFSFQLYPNPTNREVDIVFAEHLVDANIVVTNTIGEKVYEQKMNGNKLNISTQYWQDGIYIITIQFNQYSVNQMKLCVVH